MKVQSRFTLVKRLGPVVVLRPKRNLIGDEETDELEQLIGELDVEAVRGVVINLADVELVNTLGLQTIIGAHIRFSKRGAKVHVCQLTRRVQNVYVVIKLGLLIPCFDTEELAVAACAGDSTAEA